MASAGMNKSTVSRGSDSVLAPGIHLDLSGRAMDSVEAIVAMRLLGQGLNDEEEAVGQATEGEKGDKVPLSSSSLGCLAEPKHKALAVAPGIEAGALMSAGTTKATTSSDWALCSPHTNSAEADNPHALVSVKMNDATLSGLDALGRGKRSNRALSLLGNLAWGTAGDRLQSLNLAGNDLTCDELTALLGANGKP